MNGGSLERGRPIIIGHRGSAAHAPENTLASFRRAASDGADMVELDVHLSKDMALMVIHDGTVDRTTNGSGPVRDMTLSQLKELDAGGGERIPTLPEVLEALAGRCGINVELKGPGTAPLVHRLLTDALENGPWTRGMFLVSSFDPFLLGDFSELRPRLQTGVIVEGVVEGAEELAEMLGAVSIHPEHDRIKREHIDLWHGKGLKVFPWTVDDAGMMRGLLSWGVDGLITDDPGLMASIVGER